MFPKAEELVSRKINSLFKTINKLRSNGVTYENDFAGILSKYKNELDSYYRLNDILSKYSDDTEEFVYDNYYN